MAMDQIYYETEVDTSLVIYDKGSNSNSAYFDSECTMEYTTLDLLQAYLDGAIVYVGENEFAIPVYFKMDETTRYGYIGYLVTSASSGNPVVVKHLSGNSAPMPEPEQELPQVTSEDDGKTLTVEDGEWIVADPEPELPIVTASDNGKYLKVIDGVWAVGT